MTALFGGSTQRNKKNSLIEFRAGKMSMKGKMVHPDTRKGLVFLTQSEDGVTHFCWKDRNSGKVEEDLMVFPDDCEFKRVVQCTTGRVYVLKFKASARTLFFWMQEPKDDKDDEHCEKVNELLNSPGSSESQGGGSVNSPNSGILNISDHPDLQDILGSIDQSQLMQLIGGMGMSGLSPLFDGSRSGSTQATESVQSPSLKSSSPRHESTKSDLTKSTPTTSSSETIDKPSVDSAGPIQLPDLQNILSNIQASGPGSSESVDLSCGLSAEIVAPLLARPEIQEKLTQFLPEGITSLGISGKSESELKDTIYSPQFSQAMQTFSVALTSGQLAPLMKDFGEDVSKAAEKGDIEAFAISMEASMKQKDSSEEEMLESVSTEEVEMKDVGHDS